MREIKNKENNWEEFKEARNQYINMRREQDKYRRIEKEIANKCLYGEFNPMTDIADYYIMDKTWKETRLSIT